MQATTDTSLRAFRILAFVEGVSFLLILFITMPLKYFYDTPGPNKVLGMIHGVLFLGYCVYALQLKWERSWSIGKLLLLWLASIVPFGTFVADWKLLRGADAGAV